MTAQAWLALGLVLGVLGVLLAFAYALCQLAHAGDVHLLGEGPLLPPGPSPSRYTLVYRGERFPCRDLAEAIAVTRTLAAIQRLPERAA